MTCQSIGIRAMEPWYLCHVRGPKLSFGEIPMHGALGAASAGPGRPKIAMLVHPRMVVQDVVGGLPVMPSTLLAGCPASQDVLFVPRGPDGSMMIMEDKEVLEFLVNRVKTERFVTSDCTGALGLGAAGLLRGYKATGHWYIRDLQALPGATLVNERGA
jgi:cyclohexyl-isocyanide hydratase